MNYSIDWNGPGERDRDISHADEDACITICQGPPICMLTGEEATKTCVWCKQIWVKPDGSETVNDPCDGERKQ